MASIGLNLIDPGAIDVYKFLRTNVAKTKIRVLFGAPSTNTRGIMMIVAL